MPVYKWEGKNKKQEVQKGELEAANEEAVRAHLQRIRITPLKIKAKPKDLFENVEFLSPRCNSKTSLFSQDNSRR